MKNKILIIGLKDLNPIRGKGKMMTIREKYVCYSITFLILIIGLITWCYSMIAYQLMYIGVVWLILLIVFCIGQLISLLMECGIMSQWYADFIADDVLRDAY